MKKPRIEELTPLRGLAFLAIVMQHSLAEYIYRADILAPDSTMLMIVYHLTRFGTPTFVFLSAVLLFYNYEKKLHYPSFIRKRFGDIYVPFLLWTVLYWLSVRLTAGTNWLSADTWTSLVSEWFVPQAGYQLWFVIMVFQFYLLFPLFRKAAQFLKSKLAPLDPKRQNRTVVTIIVLTGVAYAYLLYLSYYEMGAWAEEAGGITQTLLGYRSYSFVMYFFYFILGALVAFMLEKFRKWVLKIMPWTAFLSIALFTLLAYDVLRGSSDVMNLNISTYLKPQTFALILTQMFLLYGFMLVVSPQSRFRKLFTWVGRYSYGGYLVHAMVIYGIAFFTRPMELSGYHLPVTIITFLLTVIISLLISFGLSKLPGSRYLVGLARKPKNKTARNKDKTVPAEGAVL
ncbi:acyltransferase [Paenibacillus sp. PDC88]|uniref:acyltransferase n=1 Tax=Paenibacillus sp. PDC88 TaxID=1884375 RepID=UPI00089AA9DA|nr:acyltransferase [Paenibacillus sp. PDC88]SDX33000.1 Surface polysaccharide O-acyltransferase, integral membrane enzyme [Paenibacillus sp. PDC88]